MEPPRAGPEAVQELLLETPAERGAGAVQLGGDGDGVIVLEAQRGSGLRQGDRLLSARVFFERTEDAAQVLRSARQCRVSFCLKRRVAPPRAPPAPTAPDARGPLAKVARLNLLSLTALRKGPPVPPPVDVELALPKLSLLSPRAVPPPGPPTVTTEGGIPEKGGAEGGVLKVGVPKVGVPKVGVPAVPPGGGAAVTVPSLDIAVPKVGVTLALPGTSDGAAETLGRKMPKLELLCPKVCGDVEGGPKMAALEVTAPPLALEVALGDKKGSGDKGGGKGTPKGWQLGGVRLGGSSPDLRAEGGEPKIGGGVGGGRRLGGSVPNIGLIFGGGEPQKGGGGGGRKKGGLKVPELELVGGFGGGGKTPKSFGGGKTEEKGPKMMETAPKSVPEEGGGGEKAKGGGVRWAVGALVKGRGEEKGGPPPSSRPIWGFSKAKTEADVGGAGGGRRWGVPKVGLRGMGGSPTLPPPRFRLPRVELSPPLGGEP